MKKVFILLLIAQFVCIAAFLYAAQTADTAMDKTGIGNVQVWGYWNSIAGHMFWCGTAIWTSCILIGIVSKQFKTFAAQLAIGAPPFIFLVSYLGFLLI
jgi:hypothetical protein